MVSVVTIAHNNLANRIEINLGALIVTVMVTVILLMISYKNRHNGMTQMGIIMVMNSMDIKAMLALQ